MSNIILSLMPARLASIVELFGYKGDRKWGLELLMRAGGWGTDGQEPNISAGMLRSILTRHVADSVGTCFFR